MALKSVGGKYDGVWVNELKNGNTAYYINYRDDTGSVVKKKVGIKTKQSNFTVKDAYDYLIQAKHLIRTNEELPKILMTKKKITLEDIYLDYEKWAKNNKKSWEKDRGIFLNHLQRFHKQDIKQLKAKDFEDLKNEKLKDSSPRTVENILAITRAIFNHAIRNELVKGFANPISNGKVRMPAVDNKQLGFLSKDQAKTILDYFQEQGNQRLYQLTALMLFTGARFIEICSLTWGDIHWNISQIYFKKTKDGNDRYITITERVKSILQELELEKHNTDLVIPNSLGTQYGQMPKQWQATVDKLIRNNSKAGRNKITTHSLRHTHASWLAQAGVDILHIKQQLGHKKIETTMRYAHLIDDTRHIATNKISF